jgi:DMSO/TMAO reductase YedYZ molybdopterin-dependent catalytic subunit
MKNMNRREHLKALLSGLLGAAGTAIVASAVLPAGAAQAKTITAGDQSAEDFKTRAQQLSEEQNGTLEGEEEAGKWVNGAFRNAAFRNVGTGGGAFRNGGFANGAVGGGAFRNGGFANGGFRNF